jgi:hypothetical protein
MMVASGLDDCESTSSYLHHRSLLGVLGGQLGLLQVGKFPMMSLRGPRPPLSDALSLQERRKQGVWRWGTHSAAPPFICPEPPLSAPARDCRELKPWIA